MKKVRTYGEDFAPVPFGITCIPEDQLQLPSGAARPIYVACTHDGFLGCAEHVFQTAQEIGLRYNTLGWVFRVTGTGPDEGSWWEWAMLDGTLSRALDGGLHSPTFEDACLGLLRAYQMPEPFGIKVDDDQGRHLVSLS
jgi:hypothetical protein